MKNYYRTLRQAPPKLEVAKNPTRVSFKMVSSMCDNRSEIKFVKTNDFWKVWSVNASGMGNALSNYQFGRGAAGGGFEATSDDLCWLAMEGKWDDIVKTINSGMSAIELVRSL
tara:strand:+ start:47 stop:385 length:339 start_codon:yes stop_codon:yes gene_type:complete